MLAYELVRKMEYLLCCRIWAEVTGAGGSCIELTGSRQLRLIPRARELPGDGVSVAGAVPAAISRSRCRLLRLGCGGKASRFSPRAVHTAVPGIIETLSLTFSAAAASLRITVKAAVVLCSCIAPGLSSSVQQQHRQRHRQRQQQQIVACYMP